MPDIIHLLPDAVANQIAAGEVVQRPASALKELMENAIDAGASSIDVVAKDAGRTLIQVVDNGKGMSTTDARMAFERHATSKIQQANDLYAIRTMGFRGEALASIASVAEVSLRTCQQGNELGSELIISGSQIQSQQPVQCAAGSNFQVRNLFFNTPARRKFLKSNTTELKYLMQEFERLAIPFHEISFSFKHNDNELYNLPPSTLRQRIVRMFGKNAQQGLVDIHNETSIVKISGFIGKPEMARKSFGEQFFFVNNRFIRHNYLHRAVAQAFDKILPPETIPSYFIFFEIDPANIDINIHPTKTEVKFEEEQAIWQILHAAVRESLGKFNIVPSIDFDTEGAIEIPLASRNTELRAPSIQVDPTFNPFHTESGAGYQRPHSFSSQDNLLNWQKLYQDFEKDGKKSTLPESQSQMEGFEQPTGSNGFLVQLKGKYLLMPVKSGLMIIDQKRAHERILFEEYRRALSNHQMIAQRELFPISMQLDPEDHEFLMSILEPLQALGFEIHDKGLYQVSIHSFPAEMENPDPETLIPELIHAYREEHANLGLQLQEKIAHAAARAASIRYGTNLDQHEMQLLTDRLFACENPSFSPDGKSVLQILSLEEIGKKLI